MMGVGGGGLHKMAYAQKSNNLVRVYSLHDWQLTGNTHHTSILLRQPLEKRNGRVSERITAQRLDGIPPPSLLSLIHI